MVKRSWCTTINTFDSFAPGAHEGQKKEREKEREREIENEDIIFGQGTDLKETYLFLLLATSRSK